MRGEGCSTFGARAVHDVNHTSRDSGTIQKLHKTNGRERRLLGRFNHHAAAVASVEQLLSKESSTDD